MSETEYNVDMQFCCIDSLSTYLIDEADRGNSSVVIGDYELIDELLDVILNNYDIRIVSSDFDDENYRGLYDLYIDENYDVSIEKIGTSISDYAVCDADNVLISDECPCSYINYMDDCDIFFDIFTIGGCEIGDEIFGDVFAEYTYPEVIIDGCDSRPNITVYGNIIHGDVYYNY